MKMYALENASLELDATSVRYTAEEVIELAKGRGDSPGRHVIEFDDGDDPLTDIMDTVFGSYGPLRIAVDPSATRRTVWPLHSSEGGSR
jgi:hypothetical protein